MTLTGKKSKPRRDDVVTEGKEKEEQHKRKYLRKYTGNGTLPLHEALIVGVQPWFTTYARINGDSKLQSFEYITSLNYDAYPADSIETQNPIPYVYESHEELERYIESAKNETFETLFSKVENIFRKYVNAEEHYIVLMAASAIYSYFQDKFGTTHYLIFVGDNGSDKGSALLTYRYLGYRVFYVVSASAPNYFTFLGDIEECQGTTAEDEAEDIAYDRDKNKLLKGGYASGATIPKVEPITR